MARLTYCEKLALMEKLLTETPNEAQREVILRRLAEEVAKESELYAARKSAESEIG